MKVEPKAVAPVVAEQKPVQTVKPVVAEQKPVVAQQPVKQVVKESTFTPVKVEQRTYTEQRTVVVKPVQPVVEQQRAPIEPEYRPVAVVTPVNGYRAQQPQETPVYSAFETMQSRLPLTRKPFDSDDM